MAKITPADIDSKNIPPMIEGFATQVKKALTDIAQHLLNLSPLDNFSGFIYEGTVAVSAEVKIKNRAKKVPRGYIVVFCQGGTVQAGTTAWDKDFVYLLNISAVSPAVCRVFFFV